MAWLLSAQLLQPAAVAVLEGAVLAAYPGAFMSSFVSSLRPIRGQRSEAIDAPWLRRHDEARLGSSSPRRIYAARKLRPQP